MVIDNHVNAFCMDIPPRDLFSKKESLTFFHTSTTRKASGANLYDPDFIQDKAHHATHGASMKSHLESKASIKWVWLPISGVPLYDCVQEGFPELERVRANPSVRGKDAFSPPGYRSSLRTDSRSEVLCQF
jgi:hypothetical protein